MPVVDGKHYPYTKAGKKAAKKAKKSTGNLSDNVQSTTKNMGGGY